MSSTNVGPNAAFISKQRQMRVTHHLARLEKFRFETFATITWGSVYIEVYLALARIGYDVRGGRLGENVAPSHLSLDTVVVPKSTP